MKIPTDDRYLKSLPTQLRIWSPNSVATYIACPRRYWYRYGEKWEEGLEGEEKSTDLGFGDFIHQAHDVYAKAVASGADTETATELAVEHTLCATYSAEEDRFWGGSYRQVWSCDGKVKGQKNRLVKCPNSKQWQADGTQKVLHLRGEPDVQVCPCCENGIEVETVYFPDDKTKNRHTLIRSVVALCDELSRSLLRPVTLPDGRIGSEVAWARELPLLSPDGTPYMVVGSFDGLSAVGDGEEWVLPELKTTRREPNQKFFDGFLPGAQVYTYTWAAYHDYPERRPKVYMIVIQVGVGFTNVLMRPLRVPPEVLGEWEGEMMEWVHRAEQEAKRYQAGDPQAYPRNPTACHGLPGAPNTPCPFIRICALPASERGSFLRSNFHKRRED